MKEQEVKIEGVDKKIVVRELSCDEWMTILDEGFTTKLYMRLAVKEPNIASEPDFFKTLNKKQGSELLKKVNEINKDNFGDKSEGGVSPFPKNNSEGIQDKN